MYRTPSARLAALRNMYSRLRNISRPYIVVITKSGTAAGRKSGRCPGKGRRSSRAAQPNVTAART
jgi:hypothetical protein